MEHGLTKALRDLESVIRMDWTSSTSHAMSERYHNSFNTLRESFTKSGWKPGYTLKEFREFCTGVADLYRQHLIHHQQIHETALRNRVESAGPPQEVPDIEQFIAELEASISDFYTHELEELTLRLITYESITGSFQNFRWWLSTLDGKLAEKVKKKGGSENSRGQLWVPSHAAGWRDAWWYVPKNQADF